MKQNRFLPASSPTVEDQQDALQKGLGRAMQWAKAGLLSHEPLLNACLCDQRYDVQVEEPRSEWLWQLIRIVNARNDFRVPILHALYELSDDRSASQICELARSFAESGDEAFRARLYEIVQQKPAPERPWLGENQILQLDGKRAFQFAAKVRGRLLADRNWEWHDGSFLSFAIDLLGETEVNTLLSTESDEDCRRFREISLHEQKREAPSNQSDSYRDPLRGKSAEDIIAAATGEDRCFWFRGWGMHAAKADLNTVLQSLWETDKPAVLSRLLKVFSNRQLPEFDRRLIDLGRHVDEDVRRWAFKALAKNSHPAIRSFALEQLDIEITPVAVSLLVENFVPGDEERILAAITLNDDACQLHSLLMSVIDVLESNPDADCSGLGLICYWATHARTAGFTPQYC